MATQKVKINVPNTYDPGDPLLRDHLNGHPSAAIDHRPLIDKYGVVIHGAVTPDNILPKGSVFLAYIGGALKVVETAQPIMVTGPLTVLEE